MIEFRIKWLYFRERWEVKKYEDGVIQEQREFGSNESMVEYLNQFKER